MEKVKYETGATSHAVNDLILFVDNTRSCVKLRDEIYESCVNLSIPTHNAALLTLEVKFLQNFHRFQEAYCNEIKVDNEHIKAMRSVEKGEFVRLYVEDFKNWKQEHGY